MLEIAGVILSGVSLLKDLFDLHQDLDSWEQQDLEVDREWLPLALEHEILSGDQEDYYYASLRRVPTLELKGTHSVVAAYNAETKTIHRIVQGRPDDRLVLMRKTTTEK